MRLGLRLVATLGAALLVAGSSAVSVSATPEIRRPCKTVGAKAKISGRNVVCIRTPKGLVWATQRNSSGSASTVTWQATADGWQSNGTPLACPKPLRVPAPTDLSTATSVLYPGQTRGGNYKPHGGLRFDGNANNAVIVRVPMDGSVMLGARYLVDGEVQYTFDIMSPCGIMNRLGHLLVLTPKFQSIANKFPAPTEGDSRTTFVNPPVKVQAGEVMATQVGVTAKGKNVFFDWGVYDYRSTNAKAADAQWTAQHKSDFSLAGHALCWLALLPEPDRARVQSLPAGDPTSGKSSDYCA